MIALFAVLFAFEKIALVDSFDVIPCADTETKAGTEAIVDHVLETGATHVFWRNQSGSVVRYPSAEEDRRKLRLPLDKRRLGRDDPFGWARLDRGADVDNLIAQAFADLKRKGIGTGIHFTFEESHCNSFTLGQWNLEHPQYWVRTKGGKPFYGRCSLAYDEVYEHKMRLVDELIAMGPETLCLDMYRNGGLSLAWEYTPKLEAEFRAAYGEEAPDDPTDERWIRLVSKSTERYLRGVSERCHAAGVRFLVELVKIPPVAKDDRFLWTTYGFDWRKLAAAGLFDGLVVQSVDISPSDVFGSVERAYRYVQANRGTAKVFFHCSAYDYAKGIPTYAKLTGLSYGAVARRLLELARDCGGEGVVLECVDWHNYTEELNREIRAFKGKER